MTRVRQRTALLVLLIAALGSTAQLRAQSAAPITVVKAGRLLDPRSGKVLAPASVLIDGTKIKEVGSPSQIKIPSGATIVDLGKATLLPGLIDSHTHLMVDPIYPSEVERARRYNGGFAADLLLAIVESPSKRVLMGAQSAPEDLESGITTVRNLGHSGTVAIRNCATPSTRGAYLARGSWLQDANSLRVVPTFRVSIPLSPMRSCSRSSY